MNQVPIVEDNFTNFMSRLRLYLEGDYHVVPGSFNFQSVEVVADGFSGSRTPSGTTFKAYFAVVVEKDGERYVGREGLDLTAEDARRRRGEQQ